jgi:biotin-(acetyl-CoA carboxylase) ligase
MLETYRENMAYINEKKFVKAINKEVIIVGIDDDGSLIIKENEIQSKITYGEIV